MFENLKFAATPANARRLLTFNRVKGTATTDEVRELASRDTVAERLAECGETLDSQQQSILQRVMDWNGRGLVLVDKLEQGRDLAMVVCKLRKPDKILVLANTSQFGHWAQHFIRTMPDAKICVFGNPRHKSSAGPREGWTFSDSPDPNADIIITGFMSVAWHDLLANWVPDQVFVEEFSGAGSAGSTHKHGQLLKSMFKELPSPLFIQNVSGYRKNGSSLSSVGTQRYGLYMDLERLLDFGVWASTGFPATTLFTEAPTTIRAMHSYGYGSMDAWRALPMLGVSTELVATENGPIVDHLDQSVAKHSKGPKANGFSRVIERERESLANQGQTASSLVRAALAGDASAKTLIEGLRTVQWANAKAASIRSIIEDVGIYPAHSLIIADNPNLRRALMLGLSFTGYDKSSYCEILPASADRENVISRFLYAQDNLTGSGAMKRPVNALIVSLEDLDTSGLLHMANNIIFAEWPLDPAVYDVVKEEYASPHDCRLVQTTLVGTIEEEIRKQITNL